MALRKILARFLTLLEESLQQNQRSVGGDSQDAGRQPTKVTTFSYTDWSSLSSSQQEWIHVQQRHPRQNTDRLKSV